MHLELSGGSSVGENAAITAMKRTQAPSWGLSPGNSVCAGILLSLLLVLSCNGNAPVENVSPGAKAREESQIMSNQESPVALLEKMHFAILIICD
jgi:hypothetical protein